MEKGIFYVTLETGETSPQPNPETNGVQYAIEATPNEMKELELLFSKKQDDMDFLFKPMDEESIEKDRKDDNNAMMSIYKKLYEYGTAQTRKQIDEIGVLDQGKE